MVEDNPTAEGINHMAEGHDFAVVDGRFIVDPWLVDVECPSCVRAFDGLVIGNIKLSEYKGVFDLIEDSEFISYMYGDKSTWVTGRF